MCSKSFKNRSHAQRHILSVHANANLKDLETILKPVKQQNNDAKLIDLSQVNMNMLNLISIDNSNTTSKKLDSKVVNSTISSSARNPTSNTAANRANNTNATQANKSIQHQPATLVQVMAQPTQPIQQHQQHVQYQQQLNIRNQAVPVIKQLNPTDLNFEFIPDASFKNLISNNTNGNINNQQPTYINSNNSGSTIGNSNVNSNFILLNNQQLNFNNISNFNLVTNTGGLAQNQVTPQFMVNGTGNK